MHIPKFILVQPEVVSINILGQSVIGQISIQSQSVIIYILGKYVNCKILTSSLCGIGQIYRSGKFVNGKITLRISILLT